MITFSELLVSVIVGIVFGVFAVALMAVRDIIEYKKKETEDEE